MPARIRPGMFSRTYHGTFSTKTVDVWVRLNHFEKLLRHPDSRDSYDWGSSNDRARNLALDELFDATGDPEVAQELADIYVSENISTRGMTNFEVKSSEVFEFVRHYLPAKSFSKDLGVFLVGEPPGDTPGDGWDVFLEKHGYRYPLENQRLGYEWSWGFDGTGPKILAESILAHLAGVRLNYDDPAFYFDGTAELTARYVSGLKQDEGFRTSIIELRKIAQQCAPELIQIAESQPGVRL